MIHIRMGAARARTLTEGWRRRVSSGIQVAQPSYFGGYGDGEGWVMGEDEAIGPNPHGSITHHFSL